MDQAPPAYPIVVNVKLPAMTAPNGLVGCWRRLGLIANAMKPTGFMHDPTLIANTTSGDGDTRKWLNSRKKIINRPVINKRGKWSETP